MSSMQSELVVSPADSIKTALQKINDNSKTAVVVLAENRQVLRLLTDGDIRRALLCDVSMSDNIESLPHDSAPFTLPEGLSYAAMLEELDQREIDHAIIVDSNNTFKTLMHRRELSKVWLSWPHLGREEQRYVNEAFSSNWIAPLGPNVDGFEQELADYIGVGHAVALSSGTAAIHLALILLNVKANDIVLCSSLTFVASANPILYQQAEPVFIDSEPDTWNMSPDALKKALAYYQSINRKPKAIIVVNLYGQVAKMDELEEIANQYDVPIVEDAAESLGAKYHGRHSGTFGKLGIFSFNGNKIITTSGGGMLVSDDKTLIDKARYFATQARDPAPYYQHSEVGYNYRMSNVLAGIGRGQLKVLNERVESRRCVYERYVAGLADIPQIDWMGEVEHHFSNRWLTALVIKQDSQRYTPQGIIERLQQLNVEARHVWKPMHLQPLFSQCRFFKHDDDVSERLFRYGVCLPSSSNMTEAQQRRIIASLRDYFSA